MQYIDAFELKERLDKNEKLAILDVRESYELDICKIKAIHIPMADIGSRINEIPKEDLIIVLFNFLNLIQQENILLNFIVDEYKIKF